MTNLRQPRDVRWYFSAGEKLGDLIGKIIAIVFQQVIIASFEGGLWQVGDVGVEIIVWNGGSSLWMRSNVRLILVCFLLFTFYRYDYASPQEVVSVRLSRVISKRRKTSYPETTKIDKNQVKVEEKKIT